MTLHLRDITEADLPAVLSLRNRAFGRLQSGDGGTWWERVAAETLGGRWLGVTDEGGELVGAGRIRPYEQAWGGRLLQMGGVAGVYVEPSARGQGVATTVTRGLITRMGELGDVVSCLFPTTVSLYRRSGYEVGGVQQRTTYAGPTLRDLGSLPMGRAATPSPAPRPRRARPDDAEAIHRMLRDDAARHGRSGPMPPSVEKVRRMIELDELITYVLPDGLVIYDLASAALTVEHLVAATPESAAALWGLVGSGSAAVPTVHTYLDPRDPLTLMLGGLPSEEVHQVPWMARVIDLEAAFGARGFAPLVRAGVDLVVHDDEAPRNSGRWRLSVGDGSGRAERADADPTDVGRPARVGARGLAALWCGWSASRLRLAGLLSDGSPDDDAALALVFAAAPYITEYF
ncbi:MAG TPA: GNAT family N-acetyltransferase [Humibacillus xanthopallidus]|nr:GNAT family N-acetyltransferase [Humibacillus xanthopallidus]